MKLPQIFVQHEEKRSEPFIPDRTQSVGAKYSARGPTFLDIRIKKGPANNTLSMDLGLKEFGVMNKEARLSNY